MFEYNTLSLLSLIIFFLKLNTAEWVDMPQFSDENKIYRISSTQYDQFYKFRRGSANNFSDDQRNGSQTFRRLIKATPMTNDNITDIEKANSTLESTTASYLFSDRNVNGFTETVEHRTPSTDITTEDKLSGAHGTISSIKDTVSKIFTTQPSPTSATHGRDTPRDKYYYNHTVKSNDGILQYLPVDILKSVHRTLQSQPASLEGKINFLKKFEKTLMSEIESRLTTAMTSSRRTRGADHYNYDDHDEHSIGFPSIEGALMAISFLTFAVYLVRLVMLLFRNMNNPMTTTTAATLFFGKRKRSADFDDDTARILNNMNSFVSNF